MIVQEHLVTQFSIQTSQFTPTVHAILYAGLLSMKQLSDIIIQYISQLANLINFIVLHVHLFK